MPESFLESAAKLAKQGDDTACAVIITKLLPTIRHHAKLAVCPGLDYEDAVQEGLIGLFKAIKTFLPDKDASFKTYGTACISNAVLTAGRLARGKKHSPLSDYLPIEDNAFTAGPEDLAISNEQYQAAIRSIDTRLSSFEKQVLGQYLAGLSYRQIAQVCKTTPKSVDNAMQRLRKKLKS